MTNTNPFKVGDKFTINDVPGWGEPIARAARSQRVLTVERVSDRQIYTTIEGATRMLYPSEVKRVETPSANPLKETIDTIDAKIRAAVEDNARISAQIQTKNDEVTELRKGIQKNDSLIIAYGDQITKLKELEAQPESKPKRAKVGDWVKITSGSFSGQTLRVAEVNDKGYALYGNFKNRDGSEQYAAPYRPMYYSEYEVEKFHG